MVSLMTIFFSSCILMRRSSTVSLTVKRVMKVSRVWPMRWTRQKAGKDLAIEENEEAG